MPKEGAPITPATGTENPKSLCDSWCGHAVAAVVSRAASPPKVGVSFHSCAGGENLSDVQTQAGEP